MFCQKASSDSEETSSVTGAKGAARAYTQELIGVSGSIVRLSNASSLLVTCKIEGESPRACKISSGRRGSIQTAGGRVSRVGSDVGMIGVTDDDRVGNALGNIG